MSPMSRTGGWCLTAILIAGSWTTAAFADLPDARPACACSLTPPPQFINEGEPECYDGYRDQFNAGCGGLPEPMFSPLPPEQYVYGTSGTFLVDGLQYRDTDWYQCTIAGDSELTFSVTAEFPVLAMVLVLDDCYIEQMYFGMADACETAVATTPELPPGTYFFWLAPQDFEGVPCGCGYFARLHVELASTPGDMDCDGDVDFGDINPFVLALASPGNYEQYFPQCNWLNGDINGNGSTGFDDINPFVALLAAGG